MPKNKSKRRWTFSLKKLFFFLISLNIFVFWFYQVYREQQLLQKILEGELSNGYFELNGLEDRRKYNLIVKLIDILKHNPSEAVQYSHRCAEEALSYLIPFPMNKDLGRLKFNFSEEEADLYFEEKNPEMLKFLVPKLIHWLKQNQRITLPLEFLGTIGPDSIEALPLIIPEIWNSDEKIAYYAIRAIGNMGLPAKGAIPDVQKIFQNKHFSNLHIVSEKNTIEALQALAKIGGESKEIVVFLLKTVQEHYIFLNHYKEKEVLNVREREARKEPFYSESRFLEEFEFTREASTSIFMSLIFALENTTAHANLIVPYFVEVLEEEQDYDPYLLYKIIKVLEKKGLLSGALLQLQKMHQRRSSLPPESFGCGVGSWSRELLTLLNKITSK
ncbi:MAG: hypothetical protein AABZ60_09150 [Planctomycetota bacterium]